jgi:hypothetical protein
VAAARVASVFIVILLANIATRLAHRRDLQ